MVRVALPIFALKVRGGNATHSGNKSNVLLYSKSLCSTFDCSQLVEEDGGCFFAPHSRGHRDPPLDDMSEKGKKGHSVCCFPCWVTHGFEKVQVNSRLALTQPEKTSWLVWLTVTVTSTLLCGRQPVRGDSWLGRLTVDVWLHISRYVAFRVCDPKRS